MRFAEMNEEFLARVFTSQWAVLVIVGSLLLLLVVSGCGAWASGYGSGTSGLRTAFSQWVFPLLIGVVITLIADIDRPREGLIGVSQQPLQELLDGMRQ